jgi:Zn-dependent protease with chaperone function
VSERGQAYRTDCWRCGYRRTGLAAGAPCPECGMTREEARGYRRQRSQRRLYRACLGLLLTAAPMFLFALVGAFWARVVLGIPVGTPVQDGVHPLLDWIAFCFMVSALASPACFVGLLVLPFEVALLVRIGARWSLPWRRRIAMLLLASVPAFAFASLLIPGNPLRSVFSWIPD